MATRFREWLALKVLPKGYWLLRPAGSAQFVDHDVDPDNAFFGKDAIGG